MSEQLRLIGHEADDVPVISALMQDAVVRVDDIAYDARTRRFALVGNRFCWEKKEALRARTALRAECVTRAQRKNWPARGDAVLSLLAIRADERGLTLDFSGGACVRLETECVDLLLEDLGGPWGAKAVPRHEV